MATQLPLADDQDVFEAGHTYQVRVYLTPNSGHYFAANATGKLNGKSGCVTNAFASGQFYLEYTFDTLLNAVKITKQPTSVTVAMGATASTTVTATGNSLKYLWYYNDGSGWIKSQ